ncbi:hypothetical protein HGRIS_005957 [Hohenbuehelia grisea]|uniref:DNA-directed RNA polymerase III subunit RPC9 n=1 Tax=Hohenbuehelia grisea TaxID=104357 RepID=A0ABR3JYN8_9AGAR
MEVLNSRAALLSNYEVLTLLRDLETDHLTRSKTAHRIKKEEEGAGSLPAAGGKDPNVVEISENLRTIEVEAIQYLAGELQPTPQQTPAKIQELLRGLAPYNLTKAEKLQIVNIAPQSAPVLWAIIEEVEDRLNIDQMNEIISLVQNSLSSGQPQANGIDPSLQTTAWAANGPEADAEGDAFYEDDDYMNVVEELQFDDTGEGAGVEGDLDVDDD